ncbi:OmpA family protein [Pseudomonas sp. UBA2684]|uniref:OmpA family protein n=1 Tax=Pseudomonas sp. UBA2684 TaxID=1947311 RepID=UPI000E921C92|nr:OmpA family protein [Pseudomonas sp. UBA2684]HBX57937.1 porin [Pseudomonas sp.]|tara:strand:+ start:47673 stop:48656 length:984 start_codon:yes stop_codon:yes gene_type:complete
MKLKNTLGVVIGSLVAASSMSVLAQGQGAVEVEAFGKRSFTESNRDVTNGNLFGGSVGYYLTDDVSLNLSHGVYESIEADLVPGGSGEKDIDGTLSTVEALYHFGTPGAQSLRPYVSAGFGHQQLDNTAARGQDKTTFAIAGAGVKYYFSEMFFAKAGVDVLHSLDTENTEWQAGVGVGLNFGGSTKPVAQVVEAAPEPMPEPTPVEEPAQVVRVELDVKFDFDKAQVKEESYGDIKNLADFMKQYPQTTTTVEGHTDSVGSDAYNQGLSEKRANAVRDVLVNQYGVEGERVNAAGYGEAQPVADNATDSGRAVNRRVEAEVEAQAQ